MVSVTAGRGAEESTGGGRAGVGSTVRPATVDRFAILGEDGYSEFWRRDKSPIEVMELAKLLRALRKMSSFVGRNVGDLVWSGMEEGSAIALDPRPIMGQYPVPAGKVDLMAGLAIQEALKKTEWSERIGTAGRVRLDLPRHYEYKWDMFVGVCEDIYVDTLANQRVFGYYTDIARKWRIEQKARHFLRPPTVSELFHVWWRMAADRDEERYKRGYVDRSAGGLVERGSLERLYKAPIDLLNSIVPALRHRCAEIRGVTERCDYRLELYLSIWDELLEYVKFWVADRGDNFLIPDIFQEELAAEKEDQEAVKATITSYAQLIERAIPRKHRDYTDEVKEYVTDADAVVPIGGNDILIRAKDRVDSDLARRLERVVRAAAQRRNKFERGLTSGKISRRRLYRAHTTGTVFERKETEFELRKQIILLVDATGSMSEPSKWDRAEVIYQTLFTALQAYGKDTRIFAYNEVRNTCCISELYRGGHLLTLLPYGKTASGEAIIATAMATRTRTRNRLIVHITDGASNWGCGVGEAIAMCRKTGVGLLTLGVGCSPSGKQALEDEYGKLVQFVDKTEDLPRLVSLLLKHERGC